MYHHLFLSQRTGSRAERSDILIPLSADRSLSLSPISPRTPLRAGLYNGSRAESSDSLIPFSANQSPPTSFLLSLNNFLHNSEILSIIHGEPICGSSQSQIKPHRFQIEPQRLFDVETAPPNPDEAEMTTTTHSPKRKTELLGSILSGPSPDSCSGHSNSSNGVRKRDHVESSQLEPHRQPINSVSGSDEAPPPNKKVKMSKETTEVADFHTMLEIVKSSCTMLAGMAVNKKKDEKLCWKDLVGNNKHDCAYLPSGKKLSFEDIFFSISTKVDKEKSKYLVKTIPKMISNARGRYRKSKLADKTRDLLDKMEIDVLK